MLYKLLVFALLMCHPTICLSVEFINASNNRVLLVVDDWLYISNSTRTFRYHAETGRAERLQIGFDISGQLQRIDDVVYGRKKDTLRRFDVELTTQDFEYVHHEDVLGVVSESGFQTRLVSESGFYDIDRASNAVLRHIVVDSISRFLHRSETAYIFTRDQTLLQYEIATSTFKTIGQTIPVDQSTNIAVSDSLMCLGSGYKDENSVLEEYWDLVSHKRLQQPAFDTIGFPVAVDGRTVLRGIGMPKSWGANVRLVELVRIGETTQTANLIELSKPPFGYIELHDAVAIGGEFICIGRSGFIGRIPVSEPSIAVESLVGWPIRSMYFENDSIGWLGSRHYGLAKTTNAGLTWTPLDFEEVEVSGNTKFETVFDFLENSSGEIVAYTERFTIVADSNLQVKKVLPAENSKYSEVIELPSGLYLRARSWSDGSSRIYLSDNAYEFQEFLQSNLNSGETIVAPYTRGDTVFLFTEQETGSVKQFQRRAIVGVEEVSNTLLGEGHNLRVVQRNEYEISFSFSLKSHGSVVIREPLMKGEWPTVYRVPVDSLFMHDITYHKDGWDLYTDGSWISEDHDPKIILYDNKWETFELLRHRQPNTFYAYNACLTENNVYTLVRDNAMVVPRAEFDQVTTSVPTLEQSDCKVSLKMIKGSYAQELEFLLDNTCSLQVEEVRIVEVASGKTRTLNDYSVTHLEDVLNVAISVGSIPVGSCFVVLEANNGSSTYVPIQLSN